MAYIGNPILTTDYPVNTFSGNGSTTAFTLSLAPASVNSILVAVSGVIQDPSTYTVSGTTLTFTAAPPSGTNNISVRHLGIAGIPNTPSAGSVTSASLASGQTLSLNGISFPATQSASTDANTLDDYEEGTWTPELVAIGGSFTVNPTYSARSGTYTKVGRFVYCNFTMTLASKGTSTGGPLMGIGGFPFTVGAGVSATGNFYFDALGVNWIHIELQPRASNTNGYIVGLTAAAASTAYMFHANNIANTTTIAGNFMFAV